ncbi:MAG: hypothetical protein LBD57_05645 [Endomicrobium sp.]|jgi:hypothetical protein|uniref:hypothetical protein n=1 Tax=Candidatus Endomicrobiellum cubanum TaxID=3242325 RepID=UPI0028202130|nr:hypothetical protein [Endomicrobium sp.]
MNKVFTFFVMFFLLTSQGIANPYTSFNSVLDALSTQDAQKSLDIFTKDFGQVISGGTFGVGDALGPLGVYASLKISYRSISKDNIIVKDTDSKGLFFPMLHFCIGLPYDFNTILRLSRFDDTTIIGAGLLYELFRPKAVIVPAISLQSVYNNACANTDSNEFKAWNLKNSILLQFSKIPLLKPYVGLNYDITHLSAYTSKYAGMSSDVNGFGYGAGLSVSLGVFNFIFDVFTYSDEPTYSFGMFMSF